MVLTREKKGLDYLKFDVDTKISKRNKLILKWNAFKWLILNRKGIRKYFSDLITLGIDVMTLLWKNYMVFVYALKRKV